MNKLEKQLKELPIKSVPPSLDKRVEETLTEYEIGHPQGIFHRLCFLTCAAAALLLMSFGLWTLLRDPHAQVVSDEPVICYVDVDPAFVSIFATEPEQKDFFLRRKEQMD